MKANSLQTVFEMFWEFHPQFGQGHEPSVSECHTASCGGIEILLWYSWGSDLIRNPLEGRCFCVKRTLIRFPPPPIKKPLARDRKWLFCLMLR